MNRVDRLWRLFFLAFVGGLVICLGRELQQDSSWLTIYSKTYIGITSVICFIVGSAAISIAVFLLPDVIYAKDKDKK